MQMEAMPSPLSSRPERTRISCHAALDKAACAPFRKEGCMRYTNASKINRMSGVAQWRDLLFIVRIIESARKRYLPFVIPTGAYPDFLPRSTGQGPVYALP